MNCVDATELRRVCVFFLCIFHKCSSLLDLLYIVTPCAVCKCQKSCTLAWNEFTFTRAAVQHPCIYMYVHIGT